MTLEELKTKIDTRIGMISEVSTIGVGERMSATLTYRSPNGTLLFTIQCGLRGISPERWTFSGTSSAIPGSDVWCELCGYGR